MKTPKLLLPLFLASMFAASFAFAAAETESKQAACCAKAAKKDGAACAHSCCVEAAKGGKNCATCGGAGEIAAKK